MGFENSPRLNARIEPHGRPAAWGVCVYGQDVLNLNRSAHPSVSIRLATENSEAPTLRWGFVFYAPNCLEIGTSKLLTKGHYLSILIIR